MLSKSFWKDLAERATKTFAQTLLAVLAVGVPIWEMDWASALGIAAGATVLSALTSVASAGAGNHQSASLVGAPGKHRADEAEKAANTAIRAAAQSAAGAYQSAMLTQQARESAEASMKSSDEVRKHAEESSRHAQEVIKLSEEATNLKRDEDEGGIGV